MKLGLLSDTHNDTGNLQKAVSIFNDYEIDLLIHCGDVTSIKLLQWLKALPMILTFGNGDIANGEMKTMIMQFNPDNFAAYSFQGKIGDKQIGVTHGHIKEIMEGMI